MQILKECEFDIIQPWVDLFNAWFVQHVDNYKAVVVHSSRKQFST